MQNGVESTSQEGRPAPPSWAAPFSTKNAIALPKEFVQQQSSLNNSVSVFPTAAKVQTPIVNLPAEALGPTTTTTTAPGTTPSQSLTLAVGNEPGTLKSASLLPYSPTSSSINQMSPTSSPAMNRGLSLKERILAEAGTPKTTVRADGTPIVEQVRVVEVPMVEEVTRAVNMRRLIEREKHVPKVEMHHVTKYYDVPKLKVVEKEVEVPVIQEVIKTVPKKEVIKVEREVIEPVPRVVTRTVEKEVETLGEVVEVPKPFLIENRIIVPRFVDVGVPTVVAQTLIPVVEESADHVVEVKLKDYQPEVIYVNVFLPRPVERSVAIIAEEEREVTHTPVDIPLSQYNALIQQLNQEEQRKEYILTPLNNVKETLEEGAEVEGGVEEADGKLWLEHMLVPTQGGAVPICDTQQVYIVPPMDDAWQEHYDPTKDHIASTANADLPREPSAGACCERCRSTMGSTIERGIIT